MPNYRDVAAFLHVEESGLFFFDSAYRPVPLARRERHHHPDTSCFADLGNLF